VTTIKLRLISDCERSDAGRLVGLGRVGHASGHSSAGFTLVELMIVLAIVAISLALAVPSFVSFSQRSALRGAIEQYNSTLAEGRLDAVKRNRYTEVDFSTISLPSKVSVAVASTIGGGAGKVTIDPKSGVLSNVADAGKVTLQSGGYQLTFILTPLGRGVVCHSSGDAVPGYPECT